MAFIDIKDPSKRKEIVEDYILALKEFKEKTENAKAKGLEKREALEKHYKPIIDATKDSTTRLASEIKLNRNTAEKSRGFWKKGFITKPFDYYTPLAAKDKYYGIQRDGSTYSIGDQTIDVDDKNNISVNGKSYEGTPGLWELLMLNKPENFSDEDLRDYEEIASTTHLPNHAKKLTDNQKPKNTYKYKNYLEKLLGAEGHGIILPGDITGLVDRLKLVCAEREAGNIESTTPEIAAILDELLRRKHLTREEYNVICKTLSC